MYQFLNKAISTVAISSILITTSCAGRDPNPVMVSQFSDSKKSCRALEHELSNIKGEMAILLPKRDKTAQNVVLGVAGWFLLVPWFFMDFKGAEAQEYNALRQRYQHLSSLAVDKNCGVETESYPSIEELKEMYDAENAKASDQK